VDGRVISSYVVRGELIIGIFVGFPRICLLGILIFKGLTARRLYMSFGVKGLRITPKGIQECRRAQHIMNLAISGELRAPCEIQYQILSTSHPVRRAETLATFICRFS
jgi:hypothetical protein